MGGGSESTLRATPAVSRARPQQRHVHAEQKHMADETIDEGDLEKSPNFEQDHQGAEKRNANVRPSTGRRTS